MRTQAQILDLTDRAKCGYVLLEQSLVAIREREMMTTNVISPTYAKMLNCYNLINGIEFKYLTLNQQNAFADRLVRAGVVVKNETTEYYVNAGYADYVNFSE